VLAFCTYVYVFYVCLLHCTSWSFICLRGKQTSPFPRVTHNNYTGMSAIPQYVLPRFRRRSARGCCGWRKSARKSASALPLRGNHVTSGGRRRLSTSRVSGRESVHCRPEPHSLRSSSTSCLTGYARQPMITQL